MMNWENDKFEIWNKKNRGKKTVVLLGENLKKIIWQDFGFKRKSNSIVTYKKMY